MDTQKIWNSHIFFIVFNNSGNTHFVTFLNYNFKRSIYVYICVKPIIVYAINWYIITSGFVKYWMHLERIKIYCQLSSCCLIVDLRELGNRMQLQAFATIVMTNISYVMLLCVQIMGIFQYLWFSSFYIASYSLSKVTL